MNKFKISLILIVVSYLVIGTIYHKRINSCEERRLTANRGLSSEEQESTGSNLIGNAITTLFWPLFLISDAINDVGVFDCKI